MGLSRRVDDVVSIMGKRSQKEEVPAWQKHQQYQASQQKVEGLLQLLGGHRYAFGKGAPAVVFATIGIGLIVYGFIGRDAGPLRSLINDAVAAAFLVTALIAWLMGREKTPIQRIGLLITVIVLIIPVGYILVLLIFVSSGIS